jgi:hypothetical protein
MTMTSSGPQQHPALQTGLPTNSVRWRALALYEHDATKTRRAKFTADDAGMLGRPKVP